MGENSSNKHKWKFFNAGGNSQVSMETAEDLKNLDSLDSKLWATLSCPAKGLAIDEKTLAFIDEDSDGRIRRDELVKAAKWLCETLKDPAIIFENSSELKLSQINDACADGAKILSAAKSVLKNLGKAGADSISVSDFDDHTKIFANSIFNADSIITPASAESDSESAQLIGEIITVCGGKKDRSGNDGIDAAAIESFYAQIDAQLAWLDEEQTDASVLPLGADSADAYLAFKKVEEKIDDFFTRAQLLKFDLDALESVNPSQQRLAEILSKPLAKSNAELEELPISRVCSSVLKMGENINPAWSVAVENFKKLVIAKIFDSQKNEITAENWFDIKAIFAKYATWIAKKPNVQIQNLPTERLREIKKLDLREKLVALIAKDESVLDDVNNIVAVEKLARLKANFDEILRNFVNFERFYKLDEYASFQCGKLYIDRRVCELCVRVDDQKKHAAFAPFSGVYLLYCTCKRKGEADMNIAAAVTAGDCDNLMVGRNGIFYDRNGKDWDASVSSIVVNPISVSQAFFSPYKRFVKWVTEQVSKRAAAADKFVGDELVSKSTDPKKKIDVGTVAALGVAISGLTAAFGLVLDKFFGLGVWMPLGIIGAVLAISLPSMLIASMKLRMRNLAPLLDANGWAVNTKAKISIPFGGKLTKLAPAPNGRMLTIAIVLIFAICAGAAAAFYIAEKKNSNAAKPAVPPPAAVQSSPQK